MTIQMIGPRYRRTESSANYETKIEKNEIKTLRGMDLIQSNKNKFGPK